ncbi:hypothetical protein QE372_002930 [Agrobacterium pusense]|uniref:hypothetical protein n=1 Tax=Agrobacterium pusense TaxID=648995 RepID=UPI002854E9A5|nr:hypothetical protein [Agrobacterium pusense]MDR6190615.1 hypothetical protein [Agrobacterium pusense]
MDKRSLTERDICTKFILPAGKTITVSLGESAERAEYAVGVDWRKTVEPSQAKWFKGAFANQNIVCKLRD